MSKESERLALGLCIDEIHINVPNTLCENCEPIKEALDAHALKVAARVKAKIIAAIVEVAGSVYVDVIKAINLKKIVEDL